jgi:hypothetical protein
VAMLRRARASGKRAGGDRGGEDSRKTPPGGGGDSAARTRGEPGAECSTSDEGVAG